MDDVRLLISQYLAQCQDGADDAEGSETRASDINRYEAVPKPADLVCCSALTGGHHDPQAHRLTARAMGWKCDMKNQSWVRTKSTVFIPLLIFDPCCIDSPGTKSYVLPICYWLCPQVFRAWVGAPKRCCRTKAGPVTGKPALTMNPKTAIELPACSFREQTHLQGRADPLVALKESTAGRREEATDAMLLRLLDAVESNAAVTQRHLARELGIALGLANTYLKRCVSKGLLKVAEVPSRRYAYYVTPQGFAEKSRLTARYLAASFDFLRRARSELGELFVEGVGRGESRFILIGEGDLADVARLVAPRSLVEIVAVLPAMHDAQQLIDAARDVTFDAVVVTATDYPQEAFAAAMAAFGPERVRAPGLLRIRKSLPHALEAGHD